LIEQRQNCLAIVNMYWYTITIGLAKLLQKKKHITWLGTISINRGMQRKYRRHLIARTIIETPSLKKQVFGIISDLHFSQKGTPTQSVVAILNYLTLREKVFAFLVKVFRYQNMMRYLPVCAVIVPFICPAE